MRKQKGFSLIELLIVVAIILIIAAIAIPNFLRARIRANEASAVSSMRLIFTAEAAYYTQGWSNPTAVGYSGTLADLGSGGSDCSLPTAASACQLDDAVSSASTPGTAKSGYYFTYAPITTGRYNESFTVHGDPSLRGSTGERSFFTDASGVIRLKLNDIATSTDSPIQ